MDCEHRGVQTWVRVGRSLDLAQDVYEVQCGSCPAAWLHTGPPPGPVAEALAAERYRVPRVLPPLDRD